MKAEFKKVTKESIEAKILSTEFTVLEGSTMTVAHVTLQNGWSILGKSACASPECFDAALGQKLAYEDAFNQIWALEGYLLKQALYLNAPIEETVAA